MTDFLITIRWMYVYLRFLGASTSQVISTNNEWWWWMIMMDKWYSGNHWGLKLPDICLTGEEKPRKKPHPGNLSRPGLEPGPAAWQARMLPPVPRRWMIGKELGLRQQMFILVPSGTIFNIRSFKTNFWDILFIKFHFLLYSREGHVESQNKEDTSSGMNRVREVVIAGLLTICPTGRTFRTLCIVCSQLGYKYSNTVSIWHEFKIEFHYYRNSIG